MLPTLFAHMGDIRSDVVIVAIESHDEIAHIMASEFPQARVVRSANHGFGHGNNRGLMTCNSRYVLFLNPDTEILDGTLAELVRLMDDRPSVGLVGCRQIIADDGSLCMTSRYFPSALRAFGDALGMERLSRRRPRWLGEREMDRRAYEREFSCDWTSGSFMLARREALESAGYFDERFFMYSDETDLCRRIKTAGWDIRHLPQMTILHHARYTEVKPQAETLAAVTRMMYARKHLSPVHRALYAGAVMLRHAIRLVYAGTGEIGRQKRASSREVLATLLGRRPVPFAEITSSVSVATADAELRDAQPLGHRLRDTGSVAA